MIPMLLQIGSKDDSFVTQSSLALYNASNQPGVGLDFYFLAVYIHRKYPISQFGGKKGTARWENICMTLNDHIRYERSARHFLVQLLQQDVHTKHH